MNYVLYHANCYDGFGAAFAAWKKLGDEATYIPVSYGKPPPEMPGATKIYILDFSYDVLTTRELAKDAQVIILDHHKTAQENLAIFIQEQDENQDNNVWVEFNMNKSGALIAWDYFHSGEPVPKLIQHISDRDLWQFKIPGSRELHKALVSYPMSFDFWNTFLDNGVVDVLIDEGTTLQRMHKQLVDTIVKGSYVGTIGVHDVPMVNTSIAWSEVGEAMGEKYPKFPFVATFTYFDDHIMFSLRSKGDFDVSEVAKQFGGGGHKNAAGFKIKSGNRIRFI